MQLTTFVSGVAFMTTVLARPGSITYGPPPGGWESIDYPDSAGANLPSYPAGTGENLPYYPPASASPFRFTSTYHVLATPDQVLNGTTPVPGPDGFTGTFEYGINGPEDVICYNITLPANIPGDYFSPAKTATHIHAAVRGASGPPRLAFPNPELTADGSKRQSLGCLVGPFTTGLKGADGKDTGTSFKVAAIEANPAGFFTDFHTNQFPLGVVRGQLA